MKLLITGAWQGAKEQMDTLRSMGHEIAFLQQEREALRLLEANKLPIGKVYRRSAAGEYQEVTL